MAFDLSNTVLDPNMLTSTFTITRQEGYRAQNGDWSPTGNPVTISNVLGSVQPSTTNQLLVLPEGLRLKRALTIYTTTPLQLGDGATTVPDIVTYKGTDYTLLYMKDWSEFGYYYGIVLTEN